MRWLVTALAVVAGPAAAQDTLLLRSLEAHRHPVRLEAGGLAGAGGDLLIREGAAARFVAVGEEHGIAQITAFTAAWFTALAARGFRHLAVEVGPITGVLLDSLAAAGPEALGAFQRGHPPGFPFFVLTEETDLLVTARGALPRAADVIWGIDYDILGDRYLLERLERAARSDDAWNTVRAVRAQADSGLLRAVREGNPGHIFLFSAADEPFARLQAALRPAPGSDADNTIATMRETAAINRLFLAGRNWESNHRRATLNKQWFMRRYRAAWAAGDTAPRVMVKLGANHVYRGLNETRQYDVGSLLAMLAESEGGTSFHLLVVGGPGGQRAQFDPQHMVYVPLPTTELPADPFVGLLLEDAWTLFDLRPLRPILHDQGRRMEIPAGVTDLVFSVDALLVIHDATPSTPMAGVLEALHGLH